MSTLYFRGWVLQGLSNTIVALGGNVDAYADRFRLPLRLTGDADVQGARAIDWSGSWKRARQIWTVRTSAYARDSRKDAMRSDRSRWSHFIARR